MMNDEVRAFVEHARKRGLDPGTIRHALLSVGWKEREIAEAVVERELSMPIPVPARAASVGVVARRKGESVWPRRAREAFLHLLMFGALFTSATSLALLCFTYVDFALPDPAWRASTSQIEGALSLIRAEVAALVVAFPVFVVLWHYLLRDARRRPGQGGVRRWLGYLLIFVGAFTLSGDVISLVFFTLEGELTARLAAKVGVLFFIAGGTVWYLANTLRNEGEAEG